MYFWFYYWCRQIHISFFYLLLPKTEWTKLLVCSFFGGVRMLWNIVSFAVAWRHKMYCNITVASEFVARKCISLELSSSIFFPHWFVFLCINLWLKIYSAFVFALSYINLLKPNDIYICRNAALTSRRYILNIYSTYIYWIF